MKTRLLTFLSVLLLVLGTTPTAFAADTINYAGRPSASTYAGSCHWTIYGRVDNRMVLFGPQHCWQTPGAVVNGSTGQRLGVVASPNSFAVTADMTWIWLDTGQYPATKNVIVVNGTDWTITAKYPSSSLTCASILAGRVDTIKASYWTETAGYEGPFSGTMIPSGSVDKGNGKCLVRSSIDYDAGSRHVPSGAPVIDYTVGGNGGTGFLGDMTQCYGTCGTGVDMMFNSWRQAIIDLNNYWEVRGTTYGAWFCSNASCT